MPDRITPCLQMLATSTSVFLRALYVLTMLSFAHNCCCGVPKNPQKLQSEMTLYHFFIAPLKAEMFGIAWVPKQMLSGLAVTF